MRLSLEYLDLDYDGEVPHPKTPCDESLPPCITVQECALEDYFSGGVSLYADFAVSPLSSHSPGICN
jgi:hypothetical protein